MNKRHRARFGPSAGLAIALFNLGKAKLALGGPANAKPLLIEARNLAVEHLGAQDRRSINVGILLSEVFEKMGDVSRARRLKRDVELTAKAAKNQLGASAP